MPPRPRRPVPSPTVPPVADGGGWAPEAPADLTSAFRASARTAAEAAHGALQDAIRDLGLPARDVANVRAGASSAVQPDRWADEGGPLGQLYVGVRPLSEGERAAWEAREFARDCVHAAVGAYARALRREGVGLPATLAAVHATVAMEAVLLPAGAAAVTQRDAARCCLEAFYAH